MEHGARGDDSKCVGPRGGAHGANALGRCFGPRRYIGRMEGFYMGTRSKVTDPRMVASWWVQEAAVVRWVASGANLIIIKRRMRFL